MSNGFAIGGAGEIVTEKVTEDFLGEKIHFEVFVERRVDVADKGNGVGAGPVEGENAGTGRTLRRKIEGFGKVAVEGQDDKGRVTVVFWGALLIVSDAILSRRKLGQEFRFSVMGELESVAVASEPDLGIADFDAGGIRGWEGERKKEKQRRKQAMDPWEDYTLKRNRGRRGERLPRNFEEVLCLFLLRGRRLQPVSNSCHPSN